MNYQTYGKYTEIPQAQPVQDEEPAEQQPAAQAAQAAPAAPNAPVKKKGRGKKIALICVCVAAALFWTAAAVFSVVQTLRLASSAQVSRNEVEYSYDYGDFADLLPEIVGDSEAASSFEDYFAENYSSAAQNNMPAAKMNPDVTLELADTDAASGEMLTYQEIYSLVSPAITGITTYVDGVEYGWGTAVLFTDDGYLITNTHIVEDCDAAVITLADGTTYDAQLVGMDSNSDIAVLKIDGHDLPYAEFADSDDVMVGDEVVAIGNPLGELYSGTMTNGIISAINRNVTQEGHYMTLLQTNAALNEGNSGGALINMYGQVIGITNMKIMYNYYSTVEGIGFAVPSAVVKEVADQLLSLGYVTGEPALGIVAAAINTEAQALYDLPTGVYVAEISEGSDALNRDIQVGDIITAVDDTPVSTVDEVNAIKNLHEVGDTLTLTIYRDGETFTEEITLVDSCMIVK